MAREPVLSFLFPYQNAMRSYVVRDDRFYVLRNRTGTTCSRVVIGSASHVLDEYDARMHEHEYLAKNKRAIVRRLTTSARPIVSNHAETFEELVTLSYYDQMSPVDRYSEEFTSLVFERANSDSFLHKLLASGSLVTRVQQREAPNGLLDVDDTLYALDAEVRSPVRVLIQEGASVREYGLVYRGDAQSFVRTHDHEVQEACATLSAQSRGTIEEQLYAPTELAAVAKRSHAFSIQNTGRSFLITIETTPYILHWPENGTTGYYLFDGCTVGYQVRYEKNTLIFEGEPVIISTRSYEHPFWAGGGHICYQGPQRWENEDITFGKPLPVPPGDEGVRRAAYKIAYLGAQMMKTLYEGYGSGAIPHYRLNGGLQHRMISLDRVLTSGVKIYDNSRGEKTRIEHRTRNASR